MGDVKKYKKILRAALERHAAIPAANAPDIKYHLIINKEETEFVLLKLGWISGIFRHGLVYHFEIKNEKLWLYRNNTDIDIGARLVDKGIPKSSIVLGFVSEMERDAEGYALN